LRTQAAQQDEQALLSLQTLGGGTLLEQLFFEALSAQGLAAPEAARVADDFGAIGSIESATEAASALAIKRWPMKRVGAQYWLASKCQRRSLCTRTPTVSR
jgi:hypothetical protein